MTFDDACHAAAGYRRAGMTWAWIGKHLGFDKDRLRTAVTAQGLADGWGDSLIRHDGWGEGKSAGAPSFAAAQDKGR